LVKNNFTLTVSKQKQISNIEYALKKKFNKIKLTGFIGSSLAYTASSIILKQNLPNIFILKDKESASYFANDLENLLNKSIFFFPASFKKDYQVKKNDNSNTLLRIEVLNKINNSRNPIIVTYSEAVIEKVISQKELQNKSVKLSVNDNFNIDKLTSILEEMNFVKVDFILEPGQYAIRGGIVDIFSYSNENPYRIEFFDTTIESIRIFEINNQLSIQNEKEIKIIPNTELEKIQQKKICFLEYLPKTTLVWAEDLKYTLNSIKNYFKKIEDKYINRNPLFTSKEQFVKELEKFTVIESNSHSYFTPQHEVKLDTDFLTRFNKQFDLLKQEMQKHTKQGIQNVILCSSEEQEKRFTAIFDQNEKIKYKCIHFTLHQGYIDYTNHLAIYTDHEIFERHYKYKTRTKFNKEKAITIQQLTNLLIGDFVIHIDYGIGKYEGLHKIKTNGKDQEVLKITYQHGDILYTSIHSLHKIAKYSGKEGVTPKINQLGSQLWKKKKEKTKSKVKQVAFNLINLYAKRKMKQGFPFSKDTYLQHELESSFIFEDTPDQIKATNDIKKDMENHNPMDRLVCGDVGFGKTEVAIRAAFKAVCDNKQVAILVPTTILALQHFKTIKKRLKKFPCTIDYISRFKTKKEQKNTIKNILNGQTDIIIGTHRLVSKDVIFKNLGLLIIDEEQKFGVNIKDKIKLIKENIDTLTLSATPIPRTLQFSLLGARDLSIINTPPPNRQSVETNIINMCHEKIREAIMYEIQRNGQIYFVHNRIENINEVGNLIQGLCPEAKIKIGHGQMEGAKLEELIIEFIEGEFDVLVSTTIIENGVDIPNANTIIINNAQNFGLSDLHQMRGRVGRSNKKAFCYLISPPTNMISEESRKRLNALEQFSTLGSGFKIAMRDLDIRGAGDLLGADQSGFINDIGFDTYQKILNEAIEELKQEKFDSLLSNKKDKFYVKDCQIDTDLQILIPDSYVSNVNERLSLYKEINNTNNEKEIINFSVKIKDRFGPIPREVENLFNILRLKWIAKNIGFERIILKENTMRAFLPIKSQLNYYNSNEFQKVLNYLKLNNNHCEIKEIKEKLCLKILSIDSAHVALKACQNIYDS
jgi:transcription-repair coupling factor (superfamily II helicase)